jgi:hypothetical protein
VTGDVPGGNLNGIWLVVFLEQAGKDLEPPAFLILEG